ncbi:M14 family metallopeptidase [Aliidiomarina celeris]|uniref:M14 family metallopeptidase n=1 Tax=Aliidiomarina celeris TaxID=2249428 RepID=UPI000DEA1F37|nr:M14 family metallopeptidase [Aliidiomarina celeris]
MKKTLISFAIAAAITAPYLASTEANALTNNTLNQAFAEQEFKSNVPTIESVLGYSAGSKISSPEGIRAYYEALAAALPNQVKLVEYATSWQGRPLFYVVISSAENIQQLNEHEANMRRLADPRTTNDRQAAAIIENQPSSIWIANSVHGNEISPAESSMVTAWYLLASNSSETESLLANTLIYFDPLQNPDGRARFVSRYYDTLGLAASDDRISAEHNEPWPRGRTNHYLFDMNRDWIALTQPETRGRIAAHLNSYPLIFVDSHEMGGDLPYYFTPEAHPFNPFITAPQREGLNWVGENNAKWFDQAGYDYFTREIFDAFYPGYGASWPLYHGSLAMTYEAGSARGHHFRTQEGDVLTYAETVHRNFVAFMATIETASTRREALLERFYNYRKSAIAEGSSGDARSFIFPNTRDLAGNRKLMGILAEQGIEVHQATENFRACGNRYSEGAYVIQGNQPSYRLIRTLLDQEVPMDAEFLAEQERLRANNLPDQIYDVTAWSLPLMFNLDMNACNRVVSADLKPVSSHRITPGNVVNENAEYGFFVNWGDMNSGRFLSAALQAGLLVRSSDLAFTDAENRQFASGSLIIPRTGNPENLNEIIQELAHNSGAHVLGAASSWMKSGPNPGSANVQRMHAPEIALLWDEPVNALSAGSSRFVIEREFNYPVTPIRADRVSSSDLSRYNVMVLPATGWGGYDSALGERGRENLSQWVANGGVLITLGNATRFATQGDAPLLNSQLEGKAQVDNIAPLPNENGAAKGSIITDAADQQRYIENPHASPDWVSGVLLRANVDQEHWLTAGVHDHIYSLFTGTDIYTPLRINHGRNVVSFADKESVRASGYMWAENHEQVAHKPLVMVQEHGRGMVISFTQEPNYRAYMDGMHVLFMNAIFRGHAHARPVR